VSQGAASAGLTGNAAVVARRCGRGRELRGCVPERKRLAAPATGARRSLQQQVHAPVRSARWADEVGQRVALMAVSGTQSGSLSLVPEQMGPIEVRIHMNQDTRERAGSAPRRPTRAPRCRTRLPRLREMFAATGLSRWARLRSRSRRHAVKARHRPARASAMDRMRMQSAPEVQSVQRLRLGLVDTYA
jgi:flagellar hook-length control protein FliK